ncbi:hypothetical protein A2851_04630 [Candidatus Kaiserbacteria bacterium RIFCSPHIGHO2_01_FULL_53_29]|uniref:Uncharacterized protein n=1 Tax=Candidatus Kaiserbacteria bacterium RIFCSPHIGHO2_01_FULL_53_29 TaxID=1798480 RepID=A0A1F6CUX5_9BACT|nr:MAG: hypothetical protein A2851_04630 [Candidatus Kaiserbacteria bacterium RIFCSPHIGHO2_01_FULL_53_29]
MAMSLQLLEQALLETVLVSIGDFKRSNDRIFFMFESASEKLDATSNVQNALCEIARTISPHEEISEGIVRKILSGLGGSIPQPQLRQLLERTLERMKVEGRGLVIAAE